MAHFTGINQPLHRSEKNSLPVPMISVGVGIGSKWRSVHEKTGSRRQRSGMVYHSATIFPTAND